MLPVAGLVPQFAKGAASLGADDESIALDEALDSDASSDAVSVGGA